MLFQDFEIYKYIQISRQEDRDNCLNNLPAVYAWYRDLEAIFQKNYYQSIENIIHNVLKSNTSDTFEGRIGYLYNVSITESPGHLKDKKNSILKELVRDNKQKQLFLDVLNDMVFFQSPLYIGSTYELKSRIRDHVEGNSLLRSRLHRAGIRIEDCLLVCKSFSEEFMQEFIDQNLDENKKNENEKKFTELLEDILTRLGPVAFVKRPG
jgi:hypothetical protein